MDATIAFIGFGETGTAFAGGAPVRSHDRKTDVPGRKAVPTISEGREPNNSVAEMLPRYRMIEALKRRVQA